MLNEQLLTAIMEAYQTPKTICQELLEVDKIVEEVTGVHLRLKQAKDQHWLDIQKLQKRCKHWATADYSRHCSACGKAL